MINSHINKTKCRKCKTEVKSGNSICCSVCNVWHHLRCSGLNREQFLEHTKNKNLFWECPKCVVYRCGKCSKVLGNCDCILCNCCNKWFHKKCSLLETNKFTRLGQGEEPWFCLDCMKNNLPFYDLDAKKIKKLFNIPLKNAEKTVEVIPWCKICNKKNNFLSTAVKCQYCNHLNHKKCSNNDKNNTLCQKCLLDIFPFTGIDLNELLEASFNSNYICKCLQNHKQKTSFHTSTNKLLNLQELNFNKNPEYANSDPYANIADPVNFDYYETHAFHKLKNNLKLNKTDIFSIFHSNICSLQGNFEKLETLLDNLEHQFDVIALTETWHTKENVNFTPGILPGYQKYEGLAGLSKKGGCGVYIKDTIPYITRSDLSKSIKNTQSEFEVLWIEVISPKKENILIGVVYRHPKQKDKEFLQYLSNTLQKTKKENKKTILTGDFNLNLLKFEKNKEITEFLDFLTAKWFTPQILGPTRITENEQASLIDNFFTDFNEMQCTSGNFLEKISDHLPNFLIIENLNYHIKKKGKPYKRDYTNFDEENLINDIKKQKLTENISKINDLNEKYNTFHDKVMEAVNKNIPLKELSNKEIKRNKKPWITKGITTSIRKRTSYLNKFRKTNNQLFFVRYQYYRHKINHLIRKSKKNYYCNYFKKTLKIHVKCGNK